MDYTKEIAKITDTHLGYEDHGIFSLNVNFSYGSSSQGTGHYSICSKHSDSPDDVVGIRFVKAIVEAAGVGSWEKLAGRTVYVLVKDGLIKGIEPLPTEKGKPVVFADLFAAAGVTD